MVAARMEAAGTAVLRGGPRSKGPGGPILVVDDDALVRETLAELLLDEGYTVECADDGAEALSTAVRRAPGLVLLDVNMPVLDGAECARLLRRLGVESPILMMSAGGVARHYAEELDVDGYVTKPFDFDALLGVIELLI